MNQVSQASVAEAQAWRMRAWGRALVVLVVTALLGTSMRIAWLKGFIKRIR